MGTYFVKDMKVHKYPPINCDVKYGGEKLFGTVPKGNYVKCTKCFGPDANKALQL